MTSQPADPLPRPLRSRRAARVAAGGLVGVVAFQAAVAAGAPVGRWTQGGSTPVVVLGTRQPRRGTGSGS